nr:hypothetical protein K11D12.10 - Caenorhabditis elegans [Caenorhabditis elegans]
MSKTSRKIRLYVLHNSLQLTGKVLWIRRFLQVQTLPIQSIIFTQCLCLLDEQLQILHLTEHLAMMLWCRIRMELAMGIKIILYVKYFRSILNQKSMAVLNKPAGLSDTIPLFPEEPTHYDMGPGRPFGTNGRAIVNQGGDYYGNISGQNYEGFGHGRSINQSTQYYPVGGGCDDYIPIVQKTVIKPTVGEVGNSPYSENIRCATRNVQNPQYIQCKKNQNPRRIPALPMKIQSESNLVTSGMVFTPRDEQLNGIGNSLSSLSLNEPPDIPAPLPPVVTYPIPASLISPSNRVSMSPPTRMAPVLPLGAMSSPRIMDKEILKNSSVEGTEIY